MPNTHTKIKLDASRKSLVLELFLKVCKSTQLKRKWIPDTVFAGAINKVCSRSDITPPELNNSLKKDIEKRHDGFKKVLQVHRAKSRMCDPTTPNDTK